MISQTSPVSIDPQFLSSPHVTLSTLQTLRQKVESEGAVTFKKWQSDIHRAKFLPSALNLSQYLALRQYDLREQDETTAILRELQYALMLRGEMTENYYCTEINPKFCMICCP